MNLPLYSVRIEHGGSDRLSHDLHYVHGMTSVIELFMRASEQPELFRFSVIRMDNVEIASKS